MSVSQAHQEKRVGSLQFNPVRERSVRIPQPLNYSATGPDVLLQIGDDAQLRFTRLSTENEMPTADAIRHDFIVPAMHAQAVLEALREYLKQPLARA